MRHRASALRRQREVQDFVAPPENEPEVNAGRDLANLVPDLVRDPRGLRVVEDDRLFLVEPARVFVDLGPNRLDSEGPDDVEQVFFRRIEALSAPDEPLDQSLGRPGDLGSWSEQDGPLRLADGGLARAAVGREGAE